MSQEEALRRAIWECKIGRAERDTLPDGCDQPLRAAVERAYRELTGVSADFIFSGWGGKLTDYERAALSEGQAPEPVAQEPVEWALCPFCQYKAIVGDGCSRSTCPMAAAGMDAARAKAIEADAARYRAIRPFDYPNEAEDRYVVIRLDGKRTTFYNGTALDAAADSLATKGAGS